MITRDSLVAGVLAATDKVVQQAAAGDWQAAVNSSNDRRLLLEQLSQQDPQAIEHGFLRALRDAALESDAALTKMREPSVASSIASNAQNAQDKLPTGNGTVGSLICTKA